MNNLKDYVKKLKKTQRTFVKLLCKIKGEEYEETKYFRPDVRVRAGDFKLIERFLEKPEISIFINKEMGGNTEVYFIFRQTTTYICSMYL